MTAGAGTGSLRDAQLDGNAYFDYAPNGRVTAIYVPNGDRALRCQLVLRRLATAKFRTLRRRSGDAR